MTISLNDLKLVNTKINMLPYCSEVEDDWVPIVTEGDCDSYATAKFERLVQMGWPTQFLRLATCYVETGGYHAVLLVDWDGQTWVLDNRHPYPMEYDLLPYEWHKFFSHDLNAWEWAVGADKTIS